MFRTDPDFQAAVGNTKFGDLHMKTKLTFSEASRPFDRALMLHAVHAIKNADRSKLPDDVNAEDYQYDSISSDGGAADLVRKWLASTPEALDPVYEDDSVTPTESDV